MFELPTTGYLRLKVVLQLIPVSKSTWYDGIKADIYPKGRPLGGRSVGWRVEDILDLIDRIERGELGQ